jgi:hypothetical protein
MSHIMMVSLASPALFGALWDAQVSKDPARIEAACRALDNDSFRVGSYGYDGYEDVGMVAARRSSSAWKSVAGSCSARSGRT